MIEYSVSRLRGPQGARVLRVWHMCTLTSHAVRVSDQPAPPRGSGTLPLLSPAQARRSTPHPDSVAPSEAALGAT